MSQDVRSETRRATPVAQRVRWLCATLGFALAAQIAVAAEDTGDPAKWLTTEGRSKEWLEATARCRQMLKELDPKAPQVRKHLAFLGETASLLQRTEQFDWKRRTAIAFFENLLDDVRSGAEPTRRYAGKGMAFPYWSDTVRRVEAIWVHVPPSYDPARRYPLFLYYKCGGGIHLKDGKVHGGYRPSVDVANQTDAFHAWSSLHIQIKGRMGGEYELAEAPPALARFFAVDTARVFLSGWSDGGFTSLWLASRFPHRVAGIAPCCGNWQYSNVNDIGLLNVPVLAVDGWGDGGYNRIQFRRWHALHTLGGDAAGVWGHHGHQYKPYEDVAEFRRILAWADSKRFDPWPKRVRFATWNLSWPRAFWVTLQRMERPWLAARVDVQVEEGNRIAVRAWNVAAYTLRLSDRLVDPKQPVAVVTNGKESYRGPFQEELSVELVEAKGRFVKSADLPGGITAQIERSCYGSDYLKVADRRWLWVKPSGGDPKLLGPWTNQWAKLDTDVTDADMATHNLFLYGGPDVNRVTARIATDLPVRFGKGSFTIGKAVYDEPTHCVKFIHPNPLNPRRYVIVYAFNDAAAFAEHGYFGTKEESAWKFRSGDCVVMGIRRRPRRWGVALRSTPFAERHIVFGSDWRMGEDAPIGELTAPFGYPDILRLRADAIREAAGVDVGMIGEHTPGWGLWADSLPAGPVTGHDLATVDMLPEYVALADVRGNALAGLLERATASSAPEAIDPARTYKVAMGYRGVPSYGAEPAKMPPLHFFRTPEEFLAGGNTSLPVRGLRYAPLQVAEALTEYIRKRGSVAPRVVTSDLARYIQNPEVHRFGAYDWLHLGFDVAGALPVKPRLLSDRYTLAIGLRLATDPDVAPPREKSRHFQDVTLGADAEPSSFDFGSLDKALPVTCTASVARVRLRAGKGVLVRLELRNRGQAEVVATAALAPVVMQRIGSIVWPNEKERKAGEPFYAGCRQAVGRYRRPPVREDAALFLFDGPAPRLERLVEPNAGYNFGLIAVQRTVRVPAGASTSVPILFAVVDKPAEGEGSDLAGALAAAKDDLVPAEPRR